MTEQRLPSHNELREAVLQALEELGGEASTSEINEKVIEIMHLPEEIVSIEHPDGVCTLLDYRLRWIRNDLKGKIQNVSRG
ncbi:winged helix-turn-helix domain-containing protein, partial [Chloroflexota bacterium]